MKNESGRCDTIGNMVHSRWRVSVHNVWFLLHNVPATAIKFDALNSGCTNDIPEYDQSNERKRAAQSQAQSPHTGRTDNIHTSIGAHKKRTRRKHQAQASGTHLARKEICCLLMAFWRDG